MDPLKSLVDTADQEIQQARDIPTLENLRVKYLGKKGELTDLLKSVAQMPPEQRSTLGKTINEAKNKLQALIEQQLKALQDQALQTQLAAAKLDVTVRGRWDTPGTIHPINQVCERVTELLMSLGFKVAQGPEIEDDFHNFAALNIPPDHPARAMQDTFYFSDNRLLRTHTSPVQIREMTKHGVPTRLIALGRVYRRDLDQTHTPMFHQLEGLVVDKQCTFADLKGLLKEFFNRFFEMDIQLRFRPSYFPFTEPSAEVDIYHPKTQRWLEVLGCGMVHSNVLRNVGVNPEEYSGFAFGLGLDRLAMLRYEVPDLRLFFENDLRFLEQF